MVGKYPLRRDPLKQDHPAPSVPRGKMLTARIKFNCRYNVRCNTHTRTSASWRDSSSQGAAFQVPQSPLTPALSGQYEPGSCCHTLFRLRGRLLQAFQKLPLCGWRARLDECIEGNVRSLGKGFEGEKEINSSTRGRSCHLLQKDKSFLHQDCTQVHPTDTATLQRNICRAHGRGPSQLTCFPASLVSATEGRLQVSQTSLPS